LYLLDPAAGSSVLASELLKQVRVVYGRDFQLVQNKINFQIEEELGNIVSHCGCYVVEFIEIVWSLVKQSVAKGDRTNDLIASLGNLRKRTLAEGIELYRLRHLASLIRLLKECAIRHDGGMKLNSHFYYLFIYFFFKVFSSLLFIICSLCYDRLL
jgi:hypothetical protein